MSKSSPSTALIESIQSQMFLTAGIQQHGRPGIRDVGLGAVARLPGLRARRGRQGHAGEQEEGGMERGDTEKGALHRVRHDHLARLGLRVKLRRAIAA